ncbi:MAG: hypothetical protein VXY07_10465 [Planctomycetota bacterium]|jgi:predicted ATP-grasp superfamily ATP-dependent carboligase|nr:hypothetical protein [Planctomycetota bacterium]MEC7498417.1 hypothetical protein [Planctomycetota bacterium]MEC7602757.1 hypothetical protein [Planctomycetota bacterium]MEC7719752.1 hypothetical protein [Planctomycetota bacterium]MEC8239921.1 hypothetical protein [Planctomycetota bacterium]
MMEEGAVAGLASPVLGTVKVNVFSGHRQLFSIGTDHPDAKAALRVKIQRQASEHEGQPQV